MRAVLQDADQLSHRCHVGNLDCARGWTLAQGVEQAKGQAHVHRWEMQLQAQDLAMGVCLRC